MLKLTLFGRSLLLLISEWAFFRILRNTRRTSLFADSLPMQYAGLQPEFFLVAIKTHVQYWVSLCLLGWADKVIYQLWFSLTTCQTLGLRHGALTNFLSTIIWIVPLHITIIALDADHIRWFFKAYRTTLWNWVKFWLTVQLTTPQEDW